MPLQPITTKRIYLQIAEQIARAIRDGEFPVGTALPPERVLAERLNVSRASVRKALIALQLMGLVDVRPGDGAFVMATTPEGLTTAQLGREISAFDLIHARQIIESEVAALAATMASDDNLRYLEETLNLMALENSQGSPEEEGDLRNIERALGKRLPRVTVPDFDYSAKPQARFEVPLAERIAAIRAKKAEDRVRAKAKADRREAHVATESSRRGPPRGPAGGPARGPSGHSRGR